MMVCDAAVKDARKIVSLAGPVPPSLVLSHSATTINFITNSEILEFFYFHCPPLLPKYGWDEETKQDAITL